MRGGKNLIRKFPPRRDRPGTTEFFYHGWLTRKNSHAALVAGRIN